MYKMLILTKGGTTHRGLKDQSTIEYTVMVEGKIEKREKDPFNLIASINHKIEQGKHSRRCGCFFLFFNIFNRNTLQTIYNSTRIICNGLQLSNSFYYK